MKQLPKSKEGCDRQIDAIVSRYRRDYAGGGMFGFDMATFRINAPDQFAKVRELQALYPSLPSRHGGDNQQKGG